MPSQSQAVSRLHRFKPGDLITAEELNLLIDAIEDLDRRLAALQAAPAKRRPVGKPVGKPVRKPLRKK